ncbi:MAG TPA: hypothetical protein VFH42_01040, partial [Sporolactobacillaceae bacterium]|nr:hypothetical protein [Sporolactobacillaceae bacterium]
TLEGEKAQYDDQLQALEEKQSSLMKKLNPRWIEAREQIHHLLKEEPALNTLKFEKAKLEERVIQEKSALKALMFQLDSKKDDAEFLEERLKDIDTGLQFKQHLRLSLQELERLSRESDYIERELATDQAELEKVQKDFRDTDLLKPEELAEAEALLELAKLEPARKQELGWVTEQLKRMRQTKAVSQRLKIGAYSLPFFGVIVFVLLAFLLSPHASNSLGVVVGGSCFLLTLIFSGILWVFQRQMTASGRAYTELASRLSQLKEEDALLQKKRSLLDRYLNEEKERTTKNQREAKRNELEHRLKAKEEEWQALQKLKSKRHHQITTWLCEQGYPLLNDVTIALDYVERMDQAKQRQYTIEQLERELKTYEAHLDEFQGRWSELKVTFDIEAATLEELRHLNQGSETLLTEIEQNEKMLKDLIGRVQSLNERIARFKQECYNLMEQAGVDTEEAFFQKEARVQEKKNLDKELKELERQLMLDYTEETLQQNLEWQKSQKWQSYSSEQLDQVLDKLEEQVETLQKQLEDWNVQIRQVEEDPNHAVLPHRFEKKKDELKQEAYQWAVYKTARGLLDQAKETYKSQRLPQLLTIAEGLFQSVTAGKYKSLYYNESEGFSVESGEGKLYRVETLSRGTAEQLYLSIRLALITLFDHPITLPLIIDDSFVNFDPIRLNGVMRVLQHVSNERQVLILTCHSDPPPTLFMEEWKESSRKVEN